MSLVRALGRKDAGVISYTVHESPHPRADRLDRAERLVFVKEGFTYVAMAFTPLWLLFKQQWIALAVYLVVLAGMGATLLVAEAPPAWIMVASFALHIMVGYEADTIQRWTLRRRGYAMIGTVAGENQTDCERRFMEFWLPEQPIIARNAGAAAPGTLAAVADGLAHGAAPTSLGRRWIGLLRGN